MGKARMRKSLTVNEKLLLIDKIKSIQPKRSYRQLSESLRIPKTTIVRLMKQEDDLRTEFVTLQDISRRRKRSGKHPDVEEALMKWFAIVVKEEGVQISGHMLKKKAGEFAQKLGHQGFVATDGWLSRLKKRHQITLKRAPGEKAMTAVRSRDEFMTTAANKSVQPRSAGDEEPGEIVEGIVEQVKQDQSDKVAEKISNNNNNNNKIADPDFVTDERAKKCIEDLRRYFMQKGNENSPGFALNICYDYVNSKSRNKQEL